MPQERSDMRRVKEVLRLAHELGVAPVAGCEAAACLTQHFGWRTLLFWGVAMDHLSSCGKAANHLFQDTPFADERNRYLSHCAAHGARPAVLKMKRNELLWIARHLGPDADRGVGMKESLPIAKEWHNLHGAATAARRVIDIGLPWLRFLGWWREPATAFSYQGQLDRYVTWMRDSAASHRRRWSDGAV